MALKKHKDTATQTEQEQQREKKAEQARINGRQSTGPTTPEGKRNSSRSAISHGLTANEHTLLTCESPEEYQEVYNSFVDSLRPANKAEMRLVEKIANLDWRLERLVMMETCILNMAADLSVEQVQSHFESIDGIGFIVEAWKETCSTSHCLDLLRRYLGTLQHQFNGTLKNFRDLEKHRLARTQGGLNLDEEWRPPYTAPSLETTLPPQVQSPEPPGPALVPLAPRAIRNEPTSPPYKRPAA